MTAAPTRLPASAATASGRSGVPPRTGGSRRNRSTTSRAGAVKKPAPTGTALAKTISTRITLPVVGDVMLPPPPELVFVAGVGVLAVVGILEWPVAAVIVTGHLLAAVGRSKTIREIGEALQAA